MNDADMYRYTASIYARMTAEYLQTAHNVREFSESRAKFNMTLANEKLEELANLLGFDLVKREAKQSEAA